MTLIDEMYKKYKIPNCRYCGTRIETDAQIDMYMKTNGFCSLKCKKLSKGKKHDE